MPGVHQRQELLIGANEQLTERDSTKYAVTQKSLIAPFHNDNAQTNVFHRNNRKVSVDYSCNTNSVSTLFVTEASLKMCIV